MATPIADARNPLTLVHPLGHPMGTPVARPLAGDKPTPTRLLTSDTRVTLTVLATLGMGLSLFAGLALCDLLPFIKVMVRGF
ncbi:hypothetical protein [Nitrospirillum pindoramense]|uniref:Uncharacterized protein n=1 Tax=Nitrospirillum amazonense TaxID=28077 RepID=A0A560GRU6_9PROT|nr:hypothetical protein [Nitrospirillum amazonense]TWB36491.1 hypothetical protein FBZ90_11752 [Nitrospirillum amazonense]